MPKTETVPVADDEFREDREPLVAGDDVLQDRQVIRCRVGLAALDGQGAVERAVVILDLRIGKPFEDKLVGDGSGGNGKSLAPGKCGEVGDGCFLFTASDQRKEGKKKE